MRRVPTLNMNINKIEATIRQNSLENDMPRVVDEVNRSVQMDLI